MSETRKAAIYVRTRPGSHEGTTKQREACKTLCRDLGWEVAAVYADTDVSASQGLGYRGMLAAVEMGYVNAIAVWSLDRLVRDTADLEHLIEVCEPRKVPICSSGTGSIDLTASHGRAVLRVLTAVAMHDAERRAARARRVWAERRRRDDE